MANDKGTNQGNGQAKEAVKVSAIEKAQSIRAIASAWVEKFDPDRPSPKKDLSFSELVEILGDVDKNIVGEMIVAGELDPKRGLSKQKAEFFVKVRGKFSIDPNQKNIEDDQLEIAQSVRAYMNENYPNMKKKLTPATITGLDLYEITDGKVALKELGFNPRRMKLKHADKKVLTAIKTALGTGQKDAA